MRTISGTLDTAQNTNNRSPISRITIRDIRLRFAAYASYANPVAAGDADKLHDSVYDGTYIIRAITNGTTIYINQATPSSAVSFSTWNSISQATDANTQPGLALGTLSGIYLFYCRAGTLRVRTSANHGGSWAAEQNTGISITAPCTIAPISEAEVYICQRIGSGRGAYIKIKRAYNDGSWNYQDMPWGIFGDFEDDADWLAYGHRHLDAETIAGKTVIVYSDRFHGLSYFCTFKDGLFSNPKLLIPDDFTKFTVNRLSKIQNRLWLTARMTRDNSSEFSPALDVYLYSDDGENWTAVARDSYLGDANVQGKLFLHDPFVYYAGTDTVLRAESSYLIDPATDPSNKKLSISSAANDDLVQAEINYPASGTSPDLSMELASGDDGYFTGAKANIAKIGSDVMVEAGYKTSIGDEYATLFRGNIDNVSLHLADGERDAKFLARDAVFKHMRDWVSPFYWDMASQLKLFDDCDSLNKFAIQTGDWTNLGANIITNPGFETDTSTWSNHATGAAAGTRARSTEEHNGDGHASYRIEKTAGADGDQYGTSTTFSVQAGKSYDVSLYARCSNIVGGTLKYTMKVAGNYGAAGAAAEKSVSQTDVLSFWTQMALTFEALSNATVTVYWYFDNCTTGVAFIDDVSVQDTAPSYLSFREHTIDEGIIFSDKAAVKDFDIRVKMQDVATSQASTLGMGIIGLAKDTQNLVLLQLMRGSAGTYIQLYKRQDGNWTQLASASFTWTANASYSLRFLHRGGRFLGWAKAAATASWGAPLIDYTWSSTDGPLCPTTDGKGKVGIRVAILPLRFHAYALDKDSTVVCLRSTDDLDWGDIASSGEIYWEGERITYTGKTGSNILPAAPTFLGASDTSWQECARDTASPGCHFWDAPYGWGNHVAMYMGGSDDQFNNFGLIFPVSGEPYAAWLITDFVANYGGTSYLTTADSGHENGPSGAAPGWHVYGVPNISCQIAPCLYNCTRGANETTAIRHIDNSIVYQYPNDEFRLEEFQFYDGEVDFSHESLLKRVAAMSGVLNCVFDSREGETTTSFTNAGTWTNHSLLDWNGDTFDLYDFEVSFQCSALANGEGVGVKARGGQVATITYTTGTGYSASYGYTADTPIETQRLWQQPTASVALAYRFVVVGDFVTIYINGACVANFHLSVPPSGSSVTIVLTGKGTAVNLSSIRVPDLCQWREFAQVNDGEDAKSNIARIIGDRPIYLSSLSGASLKMSSFDQRDDLGTFANTIYSDDQTPDDVGSSRVDLQACKLEYSIVSPK